MAYLNTKYNFCTVGLLSAIIAYLAVSKLVIANNAMTNFSGYKMLPVGQSCLLTRHDVNNVKKWS